MTNPIQVSKYQYDLDKHIQVKKKEMIELGSRYGLTDRRTVKCSQQLDHLLNRLAN
ncbi:aspartyl-phosphate phosphatase Spo0E family protein [Halobacillus sp. A5]|uniref:aspartyl-phosphate phosphatase Spo0E family protein n=1 Tax=Halobacillus sp. A5 TaxID=2880263 RepID=UPI0020A69D9D|nr:aspartyl-phosphate phosphatase Spo0E family protein [Halobacillus sp. A5]MCP3026558.1 aspartyl-phosphate phosphatase Spo0E family protein [Halobacillus sp. A5]